MSSVFRFGLEKKVGALELLNYGPADGTSYFLAAMIKDILMTLIYLVVLLVFLLIASVLNNLILGTTFYHSMIIIFFLSIAVYAYGIFASSLTDNSASAITVFLGLILFFIIIMMGSFTIVSGYVRNLASVFAWVVKWFSPVYYWELGLGYVETGNWGLYLVSLALLIVLSVMVLFISHLIIKARGVRP
jgi:ABC-type multidrug transport system permease subunit